MAGTKTKVSLGLLVAFLAAVYQIYVKSILAYTGVYPNRIIENIGNDNCEAVKELKGCEKLVIHQPTGIVYLACSDPHDRRLWTPYFDLLDPAGSGSGYVAQYNPSTKKITKMIFAGLEPKSQYSAHGMDVVPSSENTDELWFYLINHRAPHPSKGTPSKIGADSVIQIFKSAVPGKGKASERLVWIKTFQSKHIHTPNDVVGSPDGKSFYFTNDHSARIGWLRPIELPLKKHVTSVGHCHVDHGCHTAISGLLGANGITTNGNGTVYVGSTTDYMQVLYEESLPGKKAKNLKKLSLGEKVHTGVGLDNLSVDKDGVVYGAAFPKVFPFLKTVSCAKEELDSALAKSPSMALKFVKNTGESSFFGEKYRVETLFQNDGSLMPTATSVAVDSERNYLYMHGLLAPRLLVCKLK